MLRRKLAEPRGAGRGDLFGGVAEATHQAGGDVVGSSLLQHRVERIAAGHEGEARSPPQGRLDLREAIEAGMAGVEGWRRNDGSVDAERVHDAQRDLRCGFEALTMVEAAQEMDMGVEDRRVLLRVRRHAPERQHRRAEPREKRTTRQALCHERHLPRGRLRDSTDSLR